MKCKICLTEDATKKGSHIVPAFILKTLFERNKEFVVSIGNEAVQNHIGRELTPEKIEEYMGREIKDEEIEQNFIPFIEDYIFCDNCEKKLGYIESLYAEKIHNKISEDEGNKNHKIVFDNDLGLISLFWYSVIFRMSIAEHNPKKLKKKEENALRNYLNINLKDTVAELIEHTDNNISKNCPYPIAIFFNSNAVNKLSSNTVVGIPKYVNPYFFIINEYIIVQYHKKTQVNGMKHSFFGLEKVYEPTEEVNYDGNKECTICIIENNSWEEIKTKTFELAAKLKHQDFVEMFSLVANHLKLSFTKQNVAYFINRILYEDCAFADRYDKGRVLNILKEELNKLPKIV